MRKTLTDKGVAALKPLPQRYAYADPELRGHYVRIQPSGVKSFVTVARDPTSGKQAWTTIGPCDALGIEAAREMARAALSRVRAGLPAVEAEGETFADVASGWVRRHVIPKGLRSRPEIERLLNRHILPAWKGRAFLAIRRSDVAALLDHVEDNHGSRQADYCLNIVRSITNWYAARNDNYNPPIVRGMRRQNPSAQARARILDDDEIRAIWKQAEAYGTFGAIVRLALWTGQRRAKLVTIKFSDLSDDVWTISKVPREKNSAGTLVLPKAAIAVVQEQDRMGANPYVFAGRGNGPVNGFSKAKARFDKACGVTGWRLHDLRRTARSLMSRAGVRPDIAERVMGHAIGGVEGVYDRHSYRDEKADALNRLAALIDSIVSHENVLPLAKRAKRR